MQWTPRVKPVKIRKLYRYARLGIYDDTLLYEVGWALYDRCKDIATVADVFREGRVPCPGCSTKIPRRIDPLFSSGEGGTHENWFHCPHCSKRLLWRDCRQALRDLPRCFSCRTVLQQKPDALSCECGQTWTPQSYRRSVRTRVRLPCPHCFNPVRRPEPPAQTAKPHRTKPELTCPKCGGLAHHIRGNIQCTRCSYKRRWREYRKSLKNRDETLVCPKCQETFRWQAWRKSARTLRTGNPRPAREFAEKWIRCRTPQQQMIQIDALLQTLHGRGPLAPLFIDSGERKIRQMLDELAS